MARRNSHIEAAIRELERHGASVIGVDDSGRHPRVRYSWRGGARFYVTASTPSDQRGVMRVRSDIRHELGVVGGRKVGERRRRRQRVETPVTMPAEIAVLPDPMATLDEHEHAPVVRRARFRDAVAGLWEECLAAVGCRPWWRTGEAVMGVTMLQAWAAWNSTRLAGGEWTFEEFVARVTRTDDGYIIPLEEGRARVRPGPRLYFVDDSGEEVLQPIVPERYAALMTRGHVHAVEVA